jgi:hypothetical protein
VFGEIGEDDPYCLTPLDLDVKIDLGPDAPIDNPPYTYHIWWNLKYRQNDTIADDTWVWGNSDDPEMLMLFGGEWQHEMITTNNDEIVVSHTFDIPGWYRVLVVVEDEDTTIPAGWEVGDPIPGGDNPIFTGFGVHTLGIIPEAIAYDAKGATHKICVKGLEGDEPYPIEWRIEAGVQLGPEDIKVIDPRPASPTYGDLVDWDPAVVAGYPCIEIKAMARGDVHIYADIAGHICGWGPGDNGICKDQATMMFGKTLSFTPRRSGVSSTTPSSTSTLT